MSSWNTIESDAGVFTELIEKLGVTDVQFEELLSIDNDSLLQVGPLYGVIFLFKYRQSEFQQSYNNSQPLDGEYAHIDPELLFFAHQKIQNACATQAVLSLLMNQPQTLNIGSELSSFKEFVGSFDSELKGESISNADTIRHVHNSFSRPNPFVDESNEPHDRDENDDGLYHFIAYVPVNGVLYELDGLHPYPISHGSCELNEFAYKLPQVLTRRIERSPSGELRFNLLALTRDKRQLAQEVGDVHMLNRELEKRKLWYRENVLRRENFVGLINQLVKNVGGKMTDEEWNQAIENGRQKTRQRIQERRSKPSP